MKKHVSDPYSSSGDCALPASLNNSLDSLEAALKRSPQEAAQAPQEVQDILAAIRADAQRLARDQTQLATLYRISRELASILELDDLLTSILDQAIRLVRAERGMLILCRDCEEEFHISLARGIDRSEIDGAGQRTVSRKLINHVLRHREPLITSDAQTDDRFSSSSSIVTLHIRSVLAVPLIYQEELIGAIYLDTRMKARSFDNEDLELLSALANQVAVAIHIAQLYGDLRVKNRELADMLKELRVTQEEVIRRERLSAIGQMSSAIIHDIRGPLTSVRGVATLLCKSDLTPEQRAQLAETASEAVDSLVGMTQEILDYARGEQTLAVESVNMGDLLRGLRDSIRRDYAAFEISVRVDAGYEDDIVGDRQKLWRVLYNIARNAVEAMSGEMERDKILVITSRQVGPWVELTLADTGPGIPPELYDSIFQPFATCGKNHGTGLGLSIAQSIVEAHGGEISFNSELGKGASFLIKLPIAGMAV